MASGKADSLVSGDHDLLVPAGRTKFLIEMPAEGRELRVRAAALTSSYKAASVFSVSNSDTG
jgi:hypothetical protein